MNFFNPNWKSKKIVGLEARYDELLRQENKGMTSIWARDEMIKVRQKIAELREEFKK